MSKNFKKLKQILENEDLKKVNSGFRINAHNPKLITDAILALAIATGCLDNSEISSLWKKT